MTEAELNELLKFEKEGFFTCFRTGVWRDNSGKTHDITQGDLDTIESRFSQNKEKKAQLYIGHEGKEEKGVISELKRFGDYLLAKAINVKENVKDKIKKGLLRHVSIAINPEFDLEHIALTNKPAVAGLLPLQGAFSSESPTILFQFEFVPAAEKKENRQELPLLEEPEPEKINNMEVKMPEDGKDKNAPPPGGTTTPGTGEFEQRLQLAEKEKDAAKQEATEAKNKLAAFEKKQKSEKIAQFCSESVKDGKLFPNEIAGMKVFLDSLEENTTYQFSQEKSQTQYQFMTDFINGLPKRIPLDKIDVKKQPGAKEQSCFSRLNDPDDESVSRHEKALELMKEQEITYGAALAQLD